MELDSRAPAQARCSGVSRRGKEGQDRGPPRGPWSLGVTWGDSYLGAAAVALGGLQIKCEVACRLRDTSAPPHCQLPKPKPWQVTSSHDDPMAKITYKKTTY